jgi:hypothetical protein
MLPVTRSVRLFEAVLFYVFNQLDRLMTTRPFCVYSEFVLYYTIIIFGLLNGALVTLSLHSPNIHF